MSRTGRLLPLVIILAAMLALLSLAAGCGAPAAEQGSSSSETPTSNPGTSSFSTVTPLSRDAALVEVKGQLEAALWLQPVGIRESSKPMELLTGADAELEWEGGFAQADLESARLVCLHDTSHIGESGAQLPEAELAAAAVHFAALLGWDDAALAAERFTPGETAILDHGAGGIEYAKRWVARDDQGLLTDGLIQVSVDARNKALVGFLYHPAPLKELDGSSAISQEQAVAMAKQAVGEGSADPTTTAPPGESTTSTIPLGVVLKSAELKHMDAPGVTGGADMLVWIVKLGGSNSQGIIHNVVYVDALTGKVLTQLHGD